MVYFFFFFSLQYISPVVFFNTVTTKITNFVLYFEFLRTGLDTSDTAIDAIGKSFSVAFCGEVYKQKPERASYSVIPAL